jgi:hypothetical protein
MTVHMQGELWHRRGLPGTADQTTLKLKTSPGCA